MRRHPRDPFPVQGRYRHVDPVHHDPLEIMLAARHTEAQRIRDLIDNGHGISGEATELRGIPVQAQGVGGTSPGTNPLAETIRRSTRRRIP